MLRGSKNSENSWEQFCQLRYTKTRGYTRAIPYLEGSSFKGGSEAGDVSIEREVVSTEDRGTFVPNFDDFGMESVPIMQEPSTDVAVSGQKLNLI